MRNRAESARVRAVSGRCGLSLHCRIRVPRGGPVCQKPRIPPRRNGAIIQGSTVPFPLSPKHPLRIFAIRMAEYPTS